MLKRLFYIILLGGNFGLSQNNQSSNQQWVQCYMQLNKKNFISGFDAGVRFKSNFDGPYFFIARFSLLRKFQNAVTLGGGFAFTCNNNFLGLNSFEYRPYQELGYSRKFESGMVFLRYRLEERFYRISDNRIFIGKDFEIRNRFSVLYQKYCFNLFNSEFYFWFGNEFFVKNNVSDMAPKIDMNRVIIGPGLKFKNNFSAQLLYNFQVRDITFSSIDASNVLWLTLRHNLVISAH